MLILSIIIICLVLLPLLYLGCNYIYNIFKLKYLFETEIQIRNRRNSNFKHR